MIPYKFLSVVKDVPPTGYWDHALIHDIFTDARFTENPNQGSLVVIPGKNQGGFIKKINEELNKLKWVVLIITSDEERNFPVEKIKHPNVKIWVQNPKQARHDEYGKWPLGYTSETRKNLNLETKDLDFFFAGQVTHKRRVDFIQSLRTITRLNGELFASEGFAQGLPPDEYMGLMNRAKVVPAPSGPVCAESFRVYEALETGAIPIADAESPQGDKDYWDYLFGTVPFPTIQGITNLPGYINDQVENFQSKANKIQAWWIRTKRNLKHSLINDVAELTGEKVNEAITVIVPVSPIKSHPSTEILEKCIASIRHHLNCEIIITFDGVPEYQEKKRKDYEEFTRRALFLCNTKWNATPLIFDEHTHQVGMARKALELIDTPTVLYVEGDTGFVTDMGIDFKKCVSKIIDGTANIIRYHFEGRIPEDHHHMMLGNDDGFIQSYQWSQRPHLASTAYYRRILSDYFTHEAKSFIEDKMHGVLDQAYKIDGVQGWLQHRLFIYTDPGDKNIKRSVDFDGRDGEPKHDKEQVF